MSQRTWLITGVSSGFGYELSKQLLQKGENVIGTVRSRSKIEELIAAYPNTFDCEILDVTDISKIHQVVDKAFQKFGKIDVIVSNAGYGLFGAIEELSDEQIKHILDTDLLGSIHLIKSSLPYLRK